MKICIAQCQSAQGNIEKSISNHIKLIHCAIEKQADLIVFPELSITGYEPTLAKDLATSVEDKRFDIFQRTSNENNISIGIGMPTLGQNGIHISTIVFQPQTTERFVYSKQRLHDDELPYFTSANQQPNLVIAEHKIALGICYETLQKERFIQAQKNHADVFIASVAKAEKNTKKAYIHFPSMAKEYNLPILMANSIGFCDNFLSNGNSSIWNAQGELIGQLNTEQRGIIVFDTQTGKVEIDYL